MVERKPNDREVRGKQNHRECNMVNWLKDHQTTRKEQMIKFDKTNRRGTKQGQLVEGSPNDQEQNGKVEKPNK